MPPLGVFALRLRQSERKPPDPRTEKADEQVYRCSSVRTGIVATRPRPDDPGLDPGGVSGGLVLAGEYQRRGDLQTRRLQAQARFLERRPHEPRYGLPILRFRQWDGQRRHPQDADALH